MQELFDGDRLTVGREIWPDVGERFVEPQFAVVDQEECGGGGELLGHGGEAEVASARDGGVGGVCCEVAASVARVDEQLAVEGDEYRGARSVGGAIGAEEGVEEGGGERAGG